MRYKKIFIFTAMMLFFSFSLSYADCYSEAAARYHIPTNVLKAISFIESSDKPLAFNAEGESYYADDFFDARRFISDNLDRSFDVGVMQINRWWFDKFGYPYVLGLDQCWNINFGAYILNYELKKSRGNIWKAIGKYHSARRIQAHRYTRKVKVKVAWLSAQK